MWARPDAVDAGQVDYALDIGVRIVTYFEDFFDVPFPLPKQGTLPEDNESLLHLIQLDIFTVMIHTGLQLSNFNFRNILLQNSRRY